MPSKKNRPPDFNSTAYYIEEVVRYHTQYESEERIKDGYPPVVAEDATWQNMQAIAAGNYSEVPQGLYNWMGFPPSAQRLLGLMWMTKVLYPEAADYDLYTEVAQYYKLFYHCELTQEQFDALVANSKL